MKQKIMRNRVVINGGLGSPTGGADRRVFAGNKHWTGKGPAFIFANERAGYGTVIKERTLMPEDPNDPAIQCIMTETEDAGNRTYTQLFTGSSPIADLSKSNNTVISSNQGGAPLFDVGTIKACISGNRLVCSYPPVWKIMGHYHSITGNVISGGGIWFDESCQGVEYSGNVLTPQEGQVIVDDACGLSGGVGKVPNYIDLPYRLIDPNFACAGINVAGAIQRKGARFDATINLNCVDVVTDVIPLVFEIPYRAARTHSHTSSAFVGALLRHYTCRIEGGSNLIKLHWNGAPDFATTSPFVIGDAVSIEMSGWIL